MEETFDLSEILTHYNVSAAEIANALFPSLKYALVKVNRIINGQDTLDTAQLSALAKYLGVPMSALFNINSWKGSVEESSLVLTLGKYKARLNYNGAFLTVLHENNIIYQEVHSYKAMTIEEFINHINNIIKDYENGDN